MNNRVWIVMFALCACDSPSDAPVRPDGDYVLIGAMSAPSEKSRSVPFEYEVGGADQCTLRVDGGWLEVVEAKYTVEVRQSAVACPDRWWYLGVTYTWPPIILQTGEMKIIQGSQYALFEGDSWNGWLTDASFAGDTAYVSLATPVGTGPVTNLVFERKK